MSLVLGALAESACLSPIALDKAAMSYDEVTTKLISQQLLLNIARARHHQPVHFTGISSITATFDFRMNAGGSAAATGDAGGLVVPFFGMSVAESPTVSIIPIEGEEFTRRMLMPIPESRLAMILRQGADIDLVLRMITSEFRDGNVKERAASHNRPSDPSYPAFRKLVSHLSTIQDRKALHVEPLTFRQMWHFPMQNLTPENLSTLNQQGFQVEYDPKFNTYRVSKSVVGRIVITNFDPELLPNEERAQLNREAERMGSDELLVDIRPGFVGGFFPMQGTFRLRSFYNVLEFLARGLGEEPEYDVPLDKRTPPLSDNPARTMELVESDSSPANADIWVKYKGKFYSVAPDKGYPWNKEAFRLLTILLQMTVKDLPQGGGPTVSISK